MVLARSEDWNAMIAKNLEYYHDTDNGPKEFVALDSPFRCPLPEKALGYTALAPYHLPGHWGSAGYNTVGVGMSATESIFSSERALAVDPLVENGVAENSVYNIVLPYVHTAREGVKRLGELIEKYGVAEGFGVGFIDQDETWYLETASGHRWLATRMPVDKYFVTGNQSRFRKYDPKDKDNYMASEDLIDFATKHKLYEPEKGEFDFHEAYIRDEKLDTTYNYPRVCGLQAMFTPSHKNNIEVNDFPVFLESDKKISIKDLLQAFRFHYDDTDHDPYLNNNPKEVYRPVSIFRTTQTHILQVRPELPKEIGELNFVAFGMADLGVFVPFYQGMSKYLESFTKGTDECSEDSAYWIYRKVQTLGMVDYNRYAPRIKKRYAQLEEEMLERMKEFEADYLNIYKEKPYQAKEMLQSFQEKLMQMTLDVSKELTNELFTELTRDIQSNYLFAGA